MQSKNREKNSSLKKYIVADRYAGMLLDEYVKTVMGESSRKRQKLFFSKGVYVNGRAAHTRRILKAGDMVAIRQFKDSSYGVTAEQGPIEVLYEDSDLIVLNKPAGMLVHPAGQTTSGTLANYLAGYFKEKKQMVTIRALHRLDRDTTGCVLFAKSGQAQTVLEKQLSSGQIHRSYEAIICGSGEALQQAYPDGTINAPIAKDPFKPNRRVVAKNGQSAITHFTVVQSGQEHSLLTLQLETGRTHQIRVHLAHAGYPVLGDKMYGRADKNIARQALHAVSLELKHPTTGERVQIVAPRPEDMDAVIANIK